MAGLSIINLYNEPEKKTIDFPLRDELRNKDEIFEIEKKDSASLYFISPREVTVKRGGGEIKFKVHIEEPASLWYSLVMLAGDTTDQSTKELGAYVWSQAGEGMENGYTSLHERLKELNEQGKFSDLLLRKYEEITASVIDYFLDYLVKRDPKTGPNEISNQSLEWVNKWSGKDGIYLKYLSKIDSKSEDSILKESMENGHLEAVKEIESGMGAIREHRSHLSDAYSLATNYGIKISL